MQLSTAKIAELINEIEQQFPVDKWIIDGVHIWFLARLSIYFELFYLGRDRESTYTTGASFISKARRALGMVSDQIEFFKAWTNDKSHNKNTKESANVVMLSYSVHRTLLNDAWYDKYCDPFIDAFGILDRKVTLLEMASRGDYRIPRYHPSRYIQPHVDYVLFKNHTLGAINPTIPHLEGYEDLVSYINGKKYGITVPSKKNLLLTVNVIYELASYFKRLLKDIRPSLVLIAEYYNIVAGGLILACRGLGIKTVDIQHGMKSDEHMAYGSWLRHPERGYELFPDVFWCWSTFDANTIFRWNRKSNGKPYPYVGGNLWMNMWKDERSAIVKKYDSNVQEFKKRTGKSIFVLFTPSMIGNITEWILDAIRKSPAQYYWWIRLHPCMSYRHEEIKAWLLSMGLSNYDVDFATNIPLEALLRHSDVNITAFSSTVIEAEQFNVPSVLTDRTGVSLFAHQIESGMAILANDAAELLQAIQSQIKRSRGYKMKNIGENMIPDNVTIVRKFWEFHVNEISDTCLKENR